MSPANEKKCRSDTFSRKKILRRMKNSLKTQEPQVLQINTIFSLRSPPFPPTNHCLTHNPVPQTDPSIAHPTLSPHFPPPKPPSSLSNYPQTKLPLSSLVFYSKPSPLIVNQQSNASRPISSLPTQSKQIPTNNEIQEPKVENHPPQSPTANFRFP